MHKDIIHIEIVMLGVFWHIKSGVNGGKRVKIWNDINKWKSCYRFVIDCVESDNGACGDLIIISLLTVIDMTNII